MSQQDLKAQHGEYYLMLDEWRRLVVELEGYKARELELRKKLFAGAFPAPIEGTQRVTLTDGTVLKGVFKLNRKLDMDVLNGLNLPQRTKDVVVRMKPELDMKMYRTLSDEDRTIFDDCLTITPGTPSLEIEDPETKKKK